MQKCDDLRKRREIFKKVGGSYGQKILLWNEKICMEMPSLAFFAETSWDRLLVPFFFFFLLIKSLQFKYLFFIFTVFFFYQTTFISCPFLFLCFLTYLFPLREFDATHQLYQLNIKQNTVRQSK